MYLILPLWSHILWLNLGRNDFELVLWPLEWRLISGWAFAQFLCLISLRCPHEETSGPYIPIAKFRGEKPPRNFAEKNLGEISDFYFSPRKIFFRARKGCSAAKREKRVFVLGLLVHINDISNEKVGAHRKGKKSKFRFCPTFDMSYWNVYPLQKCKKHLCCNLC